MNRYEITYVTRPGQAPAIAIVSDEYFSEFCSDKIVLKIERISE